MVGSRRNEVEGPGQRISRFTPYFVDEEFQQRSTTLYCGSGTTVLHISPS